MHAAFSSVKKHLCIIILLFGFLTARAQVMYDNIVFRIDSFANIGLPKSALKEVEKLDSLARKNNDAAQQVRAAVYRMTFQSFLEENALDAIIGQLKKDIDKANYPVKPVLQSLLAQMYWQYYQQNRYQFSQRTRQVVPDSDFNLWDLHTIISQTAHLYDLSLADAAKEQNTPISVMDGVLEGDSTTRYLRPTLYDLLIQRALEFFANSETSLPQPKLPFSLSDRRFFGDIDVFANLVIKPRDTASIEYKAILLLQQGAAFHLSHHDKEALADLELQRLKFLYDRSNVANKDSLYIGALDKVAKSVSSKSICADVWVTEGQYYQGIDSLVIAHNLFERAANNWPKSIGGSNAATLAHQMEQPELSAKVENLNIPGKPLLALLSYKNVNSANVEIYKLPEASFEKFVNNQYDPKNLGFLKRMNPVHRDKLNWDTIRDYATHTLEFKIDPLASGNYVLLLTGTQRRDSIAIVANFKVSQLAYLTRENPDGALNLIVTDRGSGRPLGAVKVEVKGQVLMPGRRYITKDTVIHGVTGPDGIFAQPNKINNSLSIKLVMGKDTLTEMGVSADGAQFDADDGPENKTILFSDRQIYRPGQTIYFNALELQTFNGKSKILTNRDLTVELKDANNKQLATLSLKTNEYGTAAGNFIVPLSILGGNFTLETDDGSLGVKVEEYKRPSFQVEFLPVHDSYKLNDSVLVKGKVTAFSGYGISQARVSYHIVRTVSYVYDENMIHRGRLINRPYTSHNGEDEIKSDTVITDNEGNFRISFKAMPDDANRSAITAVFNFNVAADVTDESGETQSGEEDVKVANQSINITGNIPFRILSQPKDSILIPLSIENLNGQQLKGKIKVAAWALKDAGIVFKNRVWEIPEKQAENNDDFRNDFPDYAFGKEDLTTEWPVAGKVLDGEYDSDTAKAAIVDLTVLMNQPSGQYRISISARTEKGDTISETRYINVVNKMPKPLFFQDWELPEFNIVKAGDSASFFVGINRRINVRVEQYNGPRLVSSKWMAIDTGVKRITIPVADTDKDVAVQFTMTYQNRVYSNYEKIYLERPSKELQLRFITFRDKLQPGQKEQWKLQLKSPNDKKPVAEILADLYDASLDRITDAQDWLKDFDQDNGYTPNYFVWNTWNFVSERITTPLISFYRDYGLIVRNYETLSLFGYNYFGGNNSNYSDYLRFVAANANVNKGKEIGKGGRKINGVVLAQDDGLPLPGVAIKLKGTKTGLQTDRYGRFSIWVPAKGTLVFSFVGYRTMEINHFSNGALKLEMSPETGMLGEVVVTGYQTQLKKDVTGSVAMVSVADAGRIPAFKSEQLLQGQAAGVSIVNNGAPGAATNVYIRGLGNLETPPITPRTNFAETAFFYPQLHTDDKGQVLIDFTIPESLTRWKFRALAHTKDLATGYLESEVVTQKQLSISANTPRFLHEGDTITISARLANLTTGKLKGKVQLQLFNAVNMQPVNLFVNKADAEQDFEVEGNTNKALSFKLAIPGGLDALDYKLTADAGAFTDGEENTLPVLTNRMLVTESMPMMVRAGQTKDFVFDKFVNQNSFTLKNKTLTLEYTSNPAWYAVQALPYLMEFPYECSEQVFNRYFANSLGSFIVNRNPVIKRVFDQWKSSNSTELLSNLEKNQELKSTLIEETPWLRQAQNESEQKKRIGLLFDLNKMSDELKSALDKLQKRQLPSGAFTWFGGDYADRYITQHIVEGIGELYHIGIGKDDAQLRGLADNALGYLDNQILIDERARKKEKQPELDYGDLEIYAWYTRSFYLDKPMDKGLKSALVNYLAWAQEEWKFRNVYEQGMIALTMQRYNKVDVTAQIERSLLETAQNSDELGMYWAKNQLGYYWYESPIETQSLLIDLFTEAGDNAKAVDEMKIWLLRNKQTNDWQTTKATAAACYALLLKGSNLLADTAATSIKLNGKPLNELKSDIKADAGTGYIKTSWVDEQVKPALGKVELKNNGTIVSWGALHWQYLENLDKITSSNTNIHLQRKYFIQTQTDAGPVLTAVDATHQPKTGDLLKVVVYLTADRDFEYVQLKDMRPAGTEPVDALSTYKYQDGLYYYQVTKDVATNFFISELYKGSYVFEYRLRVAQPGNFSTGITSIQCMYAPEFNTHSEGGRMVVRP